jgi:hypothetical protein
MERTKRILAIAAVTLAAGALTYWIAGGLLQLLSTCTGVGLERRCTNSGSAPGALAILSAIAGFWFAYTGRLARLFRKV